MKEVVQTQSLQLKTDESFMSHLVAAGQSCRPAVMTAIPCFGLSFNTEGHLLSDQDFWFFGIFNQKPKDSFPSFKFKLLFYLDFITSTGSVQFLSFSCSAAMCLQSKAESIKNVLQIWKNADAEKF